MSAIQNRKPASTKGVSSQVATKPRRSAAPKNHAPLTEAQVVAKASDLVVTAYCEVRLSSGDEAGRSFIESVVTSAATVAAGADQTTPVDVLRGIADRLDCQTSPIVRERANA